MVCERVTSKGNGIEITELSPVCLEGRLIYAASFDPALDRPRVAAVSDPAPAVSPSGVSSSGSNSPETRLFFFGIAAGVIAAIALGQHANES
jgi:hypothetical protein